MAVAAESRGELKLEPGLDRARELAREANVLPVSYRYVDDIETPVSAFLKLRAVMDGPAFLLESAEQGRLGRYSFLGFRPRVELRWADGLLTELGDRGPTDRDVTDPYAGVAERMNEYRVAEPESLPPFAGGAVGFFGYDLVRTVEDLGPPNPDPLGLPDLALMLCELMLSFDHLKHELSIVAFDFSGGESRPRAEAAIEAVRSALARAVPATVPREAREGKPFASNMTRQ